MNKQDNSFSQLPPILISPSSSVMSKLRRTVKKYKSIAKLFKI